MVLDLRALSTVTDFFLICTADNLTHLTALKEHLQEVMAQHRVPVWHTEGTPAARGRGPEEPQWVLLDCGDGVVHLLDRRARDFYRLEELWADAPRLPVEEGNVPFQRRVE